MKRLERIRDITRVTKRMTLIRENYIRSENNISLSVLGQWSVKWENEHGLISRTIVPEAWNEQTRYAFTLRRSGTAISRRSGHGVFPCGRRSNVGQRRGASRGARNRKRKKAWVGGTYSGVSAVVVMSDVLSVEFSPEFIRSTDRRVQEDVAA